MNSQLEVEVRGRRPAGAGDPPRDRPGAFLAGLRAALGAPSREEVAV